MPRDGAPAPHKRQKIAPERRATLDLLIEVANEWETSLTEEQVEAIVALCETGASPESVLAVVRRSQLFARENLLPSSE